MPKSGFSILMLGVFYALCSSSVAANAVLVIERYGITEYRLDNGLRVILAPDMASQAIAFNLVYLSGSLADPEGKSGTAHLLEHLQFKGTERLPGKHLVESLSQRGIQFNATTSYDRTRYSAFLDAHQDKLEHLIALEADRMRGTRFTQADLDAEREVVLREMAQHQDNPINALIQGVFAAATPGKGVARPVLGGRDEVQRIDLDDLRAFYSRHYHPGNAVIVITGRFDADQALHAIERHFGTLPGQEVVALAPLVIPGKSGNAQVRLGGADWVAVAYPLPAAGDPGSIALAPLANIFAAEPHGRLYQPLVAAGQALGVVAQPFSFRQGGYLIFAARLAPGQSSDKARAVLTATLEGVARRPINAEELQRFQASWQPVKAQIRQNHAALASLLSEDVAAGGWALFFERHEQMAKLTPADIQRQARAWFREDRRLAVDLRAADDQVPPSRPLPASMAAAAPVAVAIAPSALPAPVDLATFAQMVREVERSIHRSALDNGLKLALRPLPGQARPVEGVLNLRFGDESSLFGKRTLADLVGTMLIRGSHSRSYQQVVDQVTAMGASLVILPEGELLKVHFSVGKSRLPEMLDLVADILQHPAFPPAELQLVRRQWQSVWSQPVDQPAAIAALKLSRHAAPYPVGDIRRHVEPGEMLTALEPLAREDLLVFHRDYYGANHGELALSGDFDPLQVQAQLQRLFGAWNSRAGYKRPVQPYRNVTSARLHVRAGVPQTGHYLGRLYFDANAKTPDNAALFVAEHVLGRKPLVSRLSRRLRDREGLSYDTRTSIKLATFDNASWVTIQADYPRGQGARLASIVKEEVARLIEFGIDDDELERAKRTILHERQLSFSQDSNILSQLPRQLYEGTTMESWIKRNQDFSGVTLEQVNAAIRSNFSLDGFVEVLADVDGEE